MVLVEAIQVAESSVLAIVFALFFYFVRIIAARVDAIEHVVVDRYHARSHVRVARLYLQHLELFERVQLPLAVAATATANKCARMLIEHVVVFEVLVLVHGVEEKAGVGEQAVRAALELDENGVLARDDLGQTTDAAHVAHNGRIARGRRGRRRHVPHVGNHQSVVHTKTIVALMLTTTTTTTAAARAQARVAKVAVARIVVGRALRRRLLVVAHGAVHLHIVVYDYKFALAANGRPFVVVAFGARLIVVGVGVDVGISDQVVASRVLQVDARIAGRVDDTATAWRRH